jgi:hypothetical protein
MSKARTSKTIGYIQIMAINIVILGVMLVVIEGLSSYVLMAYDMRTKRPIAERRHTKYDPDLGWVNEPNVAIPDMYGPGISFHTNRQGFRNRQDFDPAVPPGKYRVICSGDSFTMGYGVGDDHPWCQQLSALDPRLETANMGQGGYGVDQAYLWYTRDGSRLEHHVHLLAFITENFYRMQSDRFLGYGKPVLAVEHSQLIVRNTPVPRRAYILPWWTTHAQALRRLRVVQLMTRVSRKLGWAPDQTTGPAEQGGNDQTRAVLRYIFADLKRINDARSSMLMLVYLPKLREIKDNVPHEWMTFVEQESRELGIRGCQLIEVDTVTRQEGDPPRLSLAFMQPSSCL